MPNRSSGQRKIKTISLVFVAVASDYETPEQEY